MVNNNLTGTWISEEKEQGPRILINNDEQVSLLKKTKRGKWEDLGLMRAYGPVILGNPMHFTGMKGGSDVSARPIISAESDGKRMIVQTDDGETFGFDVYDQVKPKPKPVPREVEYVAESMKIATRQFGREIMKLLSW